MVSCKRRKTTSHQFALGIYLKRKKENPNGSFKYRAYLCACGFKDNKSYKLLDTYSPTKKLSTVRLLLALSLEFGWNNLHIYISSAFLYGELNTEIYMRVPQGMELDGKKFVLKLDKAL